MQATDSSMLKRRCRATEAMGLMATAIGKQAVTPMVPHIMQAALKVPFPPVLALYSLFLLHCLLHACAPYCTGSCRDGPFPLLQCHAAIYI